MLEAYRLINTKLWQSLEKGEYEKNTILNLRFDKLFRQYNLHIRGDEFNNKYLDNLSNHCYLFDHAIETLEYLSKKTHLVIMTNGVQRAQKNKMQRSGLNKYFEHVIISDIVGYHKPNTKIFDYLTENIGVYKKEDMIIIGDSLSSDIKGGNNYGIDTCWFNPKSKKKDQDVSIKYEIKNLKELVDIL